MDAASAPARGNRVWQLRAADAAYVLPALALTAVVYFPVTRNYFYLDDFLNLYHIVNDSLWQYVLRENGGHILLTRNSLFYLTFLLAGPHPALFYWSAFLTHVLNVWLLYLIVVRLTESRAVASFGAAFWGISPLNEGALGWYSVYGHAVVGTALLIVLAQASRCVATQQPPAPRLRALWYFLALVAATSFGTGVGVAMVLPFALFLLLYPLVRRPPLLSLVIVIPGVYVGLTRLYEYTSGSEAPARAIAADVFSSIPAVFEMLARVTGFGIARWLTGFMLPTPAPRTGWYVTLAAFAILAIVVGVLSSASVRRQLAACAMVVLGAYGIIAVGRGRLMTAAADALIEALTRYHYVAPIALTIMLCLALAQLGRRMDWRLSSAALALWYVIASVCYARSDFVIEQHQLERDQTHQTLEAIHTGVLTQPPGATVRLKNTVFAPFPLQSYVPGWAAAFTIFYPDDVLDDRHVQFIEPVPYIFEAHKHGRRISRILVPPP